MFQIGDRVRHNITGMTGKVIGYGYRISDSYYLNTVKVELESYSPIALTAEDLCDRWQIWRDRRIQACTLPHFPRSKRALSNA